MLTRFRAVCQVLTAHGSPLTVGGRIRGVDPEVTLGGYMEKHDRAAAFGGSDGQAYSVGLWVDESPDGRGLYGAAIVFVRWSAGGDRPTGHVETDYLAWGATPAEAEQRLKSLSLFDVKAALDQAIAERPPEW